MVRVSIEVRKGATRFDVAVRAESIRRALDIVGGRYPGGAAWVKFPIDPGGFFAKDSAAAAGIVGVELQERAAA